MTSRKLLRPLVLMLLFTFSLHVFYEVQSRYHIPVIGLLLLISAAGLARGPKPHPRQHRPI